MRKATLLALRSVGMAVKAGRLQLQTRTNTSRRESIAPTHKLDHVGVVNSAQVADELLVEGVDAWVQRIRNLAS